jgi:hypothetical protein
MKKERKKKNIKDCLRSTPSSPHIHLRLYSRRHCLFFSSFLLDFSTTSLHIISMVEEWGNGSFIHRPFLSRFLIYTSNAHTNIFPRRNEVSSAECVGLDSRNFFVLFLVFEVCGVKV